MFGFDVGVEGGVAEVALPTGAVEVATFVIFASATFFGLFVNALFLFDCGLTHINSSSVHKLNNQCFHSFNRHMLAYIALIVGRPLINRSKYQEALQEIRHYVSLKEDL